MLYNNQFELVVSDASSFDQINIDNEAELSNCFSIPSYYFQI
jgi:hypothetical protein